MDSGKGYFEQFQNDEQVNKRIAELERMQKKVGSIFRKGEIVEIKGSRFKIRSIGNKEMRLRLLKSE